MVKYPSIKKYSNIEIFERKVPSLQDTRQASPERRRLSLDKAQERWIFKMLKREYLRCSKENIQDVQKRIFKAQDMFNSRYSNVPTKIRPNGLDRSASWSLEILNFGHWTRKKYYLKASFG